MNALRPEDPAPPIHLPTLEGEPITLDPSDGKPRVLVFYKGSCPTCQFSMPLFDRLHRLVADEADAVWAIVQDPPDEARRFVRQYDIRMPHLIDTEPYPVSRTYGLMNVPTLYALDAGRVQAVSPAFVRTDVEVTAGWLADRFRLDPPQIFGAFEEIPELKPG